MKELLFQVKRAQLETGMRDYPIGYCPTSFVDPYRGLFYAGMSIREVAHWRPESILFLLLNGQEGTWSEVEEFALEQSRRCICPKEVIDAIYHLPRGKGLMKLFSIAILLLGAHEKQKSYRDTAEDFIAKLPHLTAALLNHYMGWGQTPEPDLEMGYVERFAALLNVPNKQEEEFAQVVTLLSILNYDHGGGSLPAFIGKGVASSLADLYESAAAACSALAGVRYSGSFEEALSLPQLLLKRYGEEITPTQIEEFLEGAGESLPGFGQTPLPIEDPRATLLYDYAKSHFSHHPLIRTCLLLREQIKVLPGIDAILGPLLVATGFPYPEAFPLLIGMARLVGVSIQIVYEREEALGGKGTPMLRPSYFYRSRST